MTLDQQTKDDFAELGVIVVTEEEAEEDETVGVLADNWTSLNAFLRCETQWRVVATAAGLIWLGLDYVAARLVFDMFDFEREVFEDIRVMELAALGALNEVD